MYRINEIKRVLISTFCATVLFELCSSCVSWVPGLMYTGRAALGLWSVLQLWALYRRCWLKQQHSLEYLCELHLSSTDLLCEQGRITDNFLNNQNICISKCLLWYYKDIFCNKVQITICGLWNKLKKKKIVRARLGQSYFISKSLHRIL